MNSFQQAQLPFNENDRLKALESYNIIGSGQEKSFDELAELARNICDTPISQITFIDEQQQYKKSSLGTSSFNRRREDSFCQYTILQDDIFQVKDLSINQVFKTNPLVKKAPNFRFYAGVPLRSPEGHNIGTLSVIDTKPNELDNVQKNALRILAKQIITLLEIKKSQSNSQEKVEGLLEKKTDNTNKKLRDTKFEANQLQRCIDDSNPTITISPDGKIFSTNKLFCDMLEYEPDELLNQNYNILAPDFKIKKIISGFQKKSNKRIYQEELRTKSKSGKIKWIKSSYNPIFDYEGKLINILNIAHDITNQVRYQKELEEAKLEAEKALVTKDNFLSNMSHEIRTPLNAIIGFSDLLKKEDLNDIQTDHADTISRAGENLLSIINNILNLSKIESGKFILESSPFSPIDVLNTVCQIQREKVLEKNIVLKNEIDNSVPQFLLGDELRFSQIIMNLINNAIKFTQEGFVKVSTSSELLEDNTCILIIKVKDSGIGIPKDKQQMIFERFTQADSTISQNFGGTGLGLNIAKLLIEKFNGELTLESKIGEGSLFTLKMPFKIENKLETAKHDVIKTSEFIHGKILLFEDNLLNQKLVRKIVSDLGHELTIVSNGLEGVKWLKNRNEVDLILMDLRMPEMDGFEATSIIRKELKLNIPIIAMSAHPLSQGKATCLEYGMNDFLSKPFRLDDLSSKIQSALKGKKSDTTLKYGSNEHPSDKLYDLKELELLASDNKEFIKEMIDVFIEETPDELSRIRNGILNNDYEIIYQTSHKLKSSYDVVGYKNITYLKEIEKMSQNKDSTEDINHVFEKLVSETTEIIKGLNEELKN